MEELVIATHNPGKVEEFKTLMQDLHLTFKCLSDFPRRRNSCRNRAYFCG
jgi:XTP/dITP diphosphohydrolase